MRAWKSSKLTLICAQYLDTLSPNLVALDFTVFEIKAVIRTKRQMDITISTRLLVLPWILVFIIQ